MEVIVAKGKEWLGHKEGSKLDIKDDYAKELLRRGVVERSKMLIRSDHDKQIKAENKK